MPSKYGIMGIFINRLIVNCILKIGQEIIMASGNFL
jgi:hypothetical protein